MQISLFKCTAEKNRVDKSEFITGRFAINGVLKNKTSLINPVITIEKTSNPITYDYNYMYIDEFKRWYFITDIVNVNNVMWEIHGDVDVLQTFKNDILSARVILDKVENETQGNLYLDDGSFIMDTRKYNTVIPFSSGLNNNGSYILICAGGA